MDEEVTYKKIEGFPGYVVSSYGEIFSIAKGKLNRVQGRPNDKGYLQVVLYRTVGLTQETKQRYIHIIVAEHFIGPKPGPRYQVNHINRDRTDCRVTNLEWLTDLDNYRHRDFFPQLDKLRDEIDDSENST